MVGPNASQPFPKSMGEVKGFAVRCFNLLDLIPPVKRKQWYGVSQFGRPESVFSDLRGSNRDTTRSSSSSCTLTLKVLIPVAGAFEAISAALPRIPIRGDRLTKKGSMCYESL
jgi:hypothetical protein